ncbi:hypothetical protein [Pseudomonas sp. Irchel 3H7]
MWIAEHGSATVESRLTK